MTPDAIAAASANGAVGLPAAIEILHAGGTAVEAAVAAVRVVEDDLTDAGVGTGGIPNLAGQVELDALLMDGRTQDAGAVAALRGFPHPIEIARRVLDVMPHVLLVADGAASFAEQQGFEPAELLTPESKSTWANQLAGGPPQIDVRGDRFNVPPAVIAGWRRMLDDQVRGTTNVLVRDHDGHLAAAVSSSGWGMKWPGRVGDSAIPGAGGYADDACGAAACTGFGELAMRSLTAFRAVSLLRRMETTEALRSALADLADLPHPWEDTVLSILAMTPDGAVAAASTHPDTTFVFQRADMAEPEARPRLHVPLHRDDWQGAP